MMSSLAAFDWGVFAKQFVFGLIGFVIGGSYAIGGAFWVRAWQQGNGHARRFWLALAVLLFSFATFAIEPLLQVFGVPDLELFNWHVLLLVIPGIGIVLALLGIVIENDWAKKEKMR